MLIFQRLLIVVGLLWGAVAGTALTALYLGTPGVGYLNATYVGVLAVIVGVPWLLLYGIWWAVIGGSARW
jgi:hypothetical protein